MEFRTVMMAMVAAASLAGCGSTEIIDAPVEATPAEPASDIHALSLGESNQIVGDVAIRNDEQNLFVTVTANTGLISDVRVCLGTSAFRYVDPSACGIHLSLSAPVSKATLAIPLSSLGEPVVGNVLYIQATAALQQKSTEKAFAYAGTFKGRIGYTVSGAEHSGACVLTADEWAGSKKEWPAHSITIGGTELREDELVDLLATPAAGDASLMVAKQIIAARLNEAAGVALPVGISEALTRMESWLPAQADVDGSLPFQIAASAEHLPNSVAFDESVNTAEMMRQFNGGKLAAPACE